jgi:REP element-mobilizing transposase RayT
MGTKIQIQFNPEWVAYQMLRYGKTMPQSLSCIYIHAVFSTKNRSPFLTDTVFRAELHAYLGGISKKLDCQPVAVGGIEDHVHILFRLSRTITIADWMKEVKRVSSMFAKTRIAEFSWQGGYGAFSVDIASLDRIAAYVRNQAQHHQKLTFQDELRQLITEHGIDWDETGTRSTFGNDATLLGLDNVAARFPT